MAKRISKGRPTIKREKPATNNKQRRKKDKGSEKTSEANSTEQFPGYPAYPTDEDIFNQNMKELELNEEGLSQPAKKNSTSTSEQSEEVEQDISEKSETDITQEDLKILDDNLSSDDGEDEMLRKREHPVDMAAEDLDVPGTELDDEDENVGEEDEENNPYSIGGDRHEDLEENQS